MDCGPVMNRVSPEPRVTLARSDILDLAKVLADSFAERAAEHDRAGSVPVENFARLSDTGLLALTVPKAQSGLGAGLHLASEVIGIIARGEPSTALILAMHYINHAAIIDRWPAPIAARLRADAINQVGLINALRVEPELGTPARGGTLATVARRTAEGWRISGHKIYSTGIPVLKWLAVWGRTDEAEPRIGTFLVPAGSPGIRINPSWDQLGMRATESHDVILEDVLIPLDSAVDIRPPLAWQKPDPVQVAWSTTLVAAIYDGVARAAHAWLLEFLVGRKPANLGASLATLPRFQEAVGEIEGLLDANRRLLRDIGRETDRGDPPGIAASGLVKSTVTNNAITAVEAAVRLSGNPGLSRANPLERHYRDVLCGRIHTPQDDSVHIAAGKIALGL